MKHTANHTTASGLRF